jgi:hypothetical protein
MIIHSEKISILTKYAEISSYALTEWQYGFGTPLFSISPYFLKVSACPGGIFLRVKEFEIFSPL